MDLLSVNSQLFVFINNLPHNPVLLLTALILSGTGPLSFIWLFLAVYLITKERKHFKVIILFFLTLFSTSALVSFAFKPLFGNLRPEYVLEGIKVYEVTSDYYSFPSSHAATAFAGAVILSAVFPRYKYGIYVLALLIALSRIYLGVHYPFDILFGGLIGYAMGKLFLFINKKYHYTSI